MFLDFGLCSTLETPFPDTWAPDDTFSSLRWFKQAEQGRPLAAVAAGPQRNLPYVLHDTCRWHLQLWSWNVSSGRWRHADVARVFGLGLGDAVSCVFGIYDPGILRCGWDTHRRKC